MGLSSPASPGTSNRYVPEPDPTATLLCVLTYVEGRLAQVGAKGRLHETVQQLCKQAMQASVSASPWSCMDEHAQKYLDLLTSCILSRCSAAITVPAAGLGASDPGKRGDHVETS